MTGGLKDHIFNITDEVDFEKISLEIFRYQSENNLVYKNFIQNLGKDPLSVKSIYNIPFLPVEFFRNHTIITGNFTDQTVFESSGTTGLSTSRHHIADLDIYAESFFKGFRYFYGEPSEYFFAALLPSYFERGNSSLVYMVDKLINQSQDGRSKFFLNDLDDLAGVLKEIKGENRKAMLIGVSFALLDFAERYSEDLSGIIVVETGGMKGRRKELTREELHSVLKEAFNLKSIHSEYGMTELLSQAWSKGEGLFNCPPWMRIMLRETNDPLSVYDIPGKTGGINIIDLANINSCSFIATGDLGKFHEDGSFEVSGRFDNSDIRGCNLLAD
jgi:phenylacetate-coenzyme A ligase PaaK-like adenylate-forming protein